MTKKKKSVIFHKYHIKKNTLSDVQKKLSKLTIKFSEFLTQNLLHDYFLHHEYQMFVFLKKYLMALQSVLRNSAYKIHASPIYYQLYILYKTEKYLNQMITIVIRICFIVLSI